MRIFLLIVKKYFVEISNKEILRNPGFCDFVY